jgi:hypothetical protein
MILFMSRGKLEKRIKEVVIEETRLQLANYYSKLTEQEREFNEIKQDIGYAIPPFCFYYHRPGVSVAEKIDGLFKHLGLEVKREVKEVKEERIVVSKKKKGKQQ